MVTLSRGPRVVTTAKDIGHVNHSFYVCLFVLLERNRKGFVFKAKIYWGKTM